MKIIFLVLALFLFDCGSKPTTQVPSGIHMDARFTAQQKVLVEKGIDTTLRNAQLSGYTAIPKRFFQVQMTDEPCVLYNGVYVMVVRSDSYDGSVYDKYNPLGELPKDQQTEFDKYVKDGVGKVYSPETASSNNVITVCGNEEGLELASQYASEHVVVHQLDPSYDAITRVHDKIPHPILPKR
jgi:hypothetical protein